MQYELVCVYCIVGNVEQCDQVGQCFVMCGFQVQCFVVEIFCICLVFVCIGNQIEQVECIGFGGMQVGDFQCYMFGFIKIVGVGQLLCVGYGGWFVQYSVNFWNGGQ